MASPGRTYVEALAPAAALGEARLDARRLGQEGAISARLRRIRRQLAGGIPMSQMEGRGAADYGVPEDAAAALRAALAPLSTPAGRGAGGAVGGARGGEFGAVGLDDPEMEMLRDQFRPLHRRRGHAAYAQACTTRTR
jgi:hypothetical protein